MATLNTTGAYSEGDAFRVIKALDIPFGTFTFDCVIGCLNDLEVMSPAAATDLVALLDSYDVANAAETANLLEQAGGAKVLVKADVLSWQVVNDGVSGASQQMAKIRSSLTQTMVFCPCLSGYLGDQYGGTSLIRS